MDLKELARQYREKVEREVRREEKKHGVVWAKKQPLDFRVLFSHTIPPQKKST